jgi:translation initiation factor eIF-2B subunit beta
MGTCRWTTAAELMSVVKRVGKALVDAQPLQLVVGNVVRRILFIIREEHKTKLREVRAREGGSTASLSDDGEAGNELEASVPGLRTGVMEAIGELQLELDNVYNEICELALEHIHANEVILTVGRSKTVETFLREAAERRRAFEVIVAESAPDIAGREMAKSLAAAGIETTVISDSAVYAIMARVNQVLLPCRALIANGGLIAPCGGHMAALAAKELSVPVVCVTGLFKLSPVYRHDQDAFNDLRSPSALIEYADTQLLPEADFLNPAYDYVPPELVDLYITNTGGHQTFYLYRLLGEYYHHDDSSLD